MHGMPDLNRFLLAQQDRYTTALNEIKKGQKKSHWMWYIFPQLKGLGKSHYAEFYGINDMDEATHYLHHPVLGNRLKEISGELLKINHNQADIIFGKQDTVKLKSCMTLFAQIAHSDDVFRKVLEKYYNGEMDLKTLALLKINPPIK
ncbi:MAG: DUF1810 domain-containing protein [Bacteroidetes bacterium CHB6]|nr:DUF1810 domain-containing protein [Bacteroidetes bacterium CHB6]